MAFPHDDRERPLFLALDPRILLAAAAAAAFCFSCVRTIPVSCLCLAFAGVLAAVRRLPARTLAKQSLAANFFVLFIWLTVPATMPGETLAALGPIGWSREGVRLALLITLKCNAILLVHFALVSGMGLHLIGRSLERLGVPAKLVFLFLSTCRQIHVVGDEWRRLQTAAKLRGFEPRNSAHTYRTIANMLGLTLVNAVDRSRRVYEAMLLRGFDGVFRTVAELRGGAGGAAFAILFFAALAFFLFLDFRLG